MPRKYETIEAAFARMIEENSYLTEEQARHLTIHGVNRNEDGTYSWKFDPHLNVWPIEDIADEFLHQTWAAITAPTLLLYGCGELGLQPARRRPARTISPTPKSSSSRKRVTGSTTISSTVSWRH